MNLSEDERAVQIEKLLCQAQLNTDQYEMLWSLLKTSHDNAPTQHALAIAPMLARYPQHLTPLRVPLHTVFELEEAVEIAPNATFILHLGYHGAERGKAMQRLVQPDLSSRVHTLTIHGTLFTKTMYQKLLACSNFSSLKRLILSSFTGNVNVLDDTRDFAKIEEFVCLMTRFEPGDIDILSRAPFLDHITSLVMHDCKFGTGALEKALDAPFVRQVTHLDLHHTLVGDQDLASLARFESERLTHLKLTSSRLNARAVPSITEAPFFAGLTYLDLGQNDLMDEGTELLANTTHNLSCLRLRENKIEYKGAQALVNAPSSTSLRKLDLSFNRLGKYGVRAIANASGLQNLQCIQLISNDIDERFTIKFIESSKYLDNNVLRCLWPEAFITPLDYYRGAPQDEDDEDDEDDDDDS